MFKICEEASEDFSTFIHRSVNTPTIFFVLFRLWVWICLLVADLHALLLEDLLILLQKQDDKLVLKCLSPAPGSKYQDNKVCDEHIKTFSNKRSDEQCEWGRTLQLWKESPWNLSQGDVNIGADWGINWTLLTDHFIWALIPRDIQ